ncbi:flagellar hook capping FlgD N-terminal domain-containing protein [Desulforamulus aquiferis]|uniref:Flagellar hook capping FlgD N-terminal domain-containing protein n=1 Tax=Desulforamulus aquiferis TaxID=1397668 RepID=A0AAW7ZG41_9FIRM|nr:flagellar hook capping FlgD N-terminal domain-containing protein [Desulforamulus aquiferis]MDO7788371.1 flagellar hook capping FlgD N-terminal domain-containing protein [Desulforamulus aquiferis]RYD03082.1 hypothetical protein N752_21975 [Desulforamulus aquiferis]
MEVNQTNNSYYYEDRNKREPVKELDKNAFLQLMIAQLRYQDPTSPMDTNKFIEQMSSFTTLEQITNLNTNILQLYALQEFSYATSLIGCEVTLNQGDSIINGVVQRVTADSAGVRIWVDNVPYGLGTISAVENIWAFSEPTNQQQQGDEEGGVVGGTEESGIPDSNPGQTDSTQEGEDTTGGTQSGSEG